MDPEHISHNGGKILEPGPAPWEPSLISFSISTAFLCHCPINLRFINLYMKQSVQDPDLLPVHKTLRN